MAPNLISHHLSVLREIGLVNAERDRVDSRWVYYSVNRMRLKNSTPLSVRSSTRTYPAAASYVRTSGISLPPGSNEPENLRDFKGDEDNE